jgi:hypothetical protein
LIDHIGGHIGDVIGAQLAPEGGHGVFAVGYLVGNGGFRSIGTVCTNPHRLVQL